MIRRLIITGFVWGVWLRQCVVGRASFIDVGKMDWIVFFFV